MKITEIVQNKIAEITEDDDFGVGQFLDMAVLICDSVNNVCRDAELPEVRHAFNLAYKKATGRGFSNYAIFPTAGLWQHLIDMLAMDLAQPNCDQDTIVTEFIVRVFEDECVRYVSTEWLMGYIKKAITEIGVEHGV